MDTNGRSQEQKNLLQILFFFGCCFFTLIFFPTELWSQESNKTQEFDKKEEVPKLAPLEIESADEGEVLRGTETGTNILRLKGRIRVRLSGSSFLADTVVIDTDNQEVYAEGNLVYTAKDGSNIKAERIIYNRRLEQGILYNASGYKNPIYFIGKNVRLLAPQRLAVSHVRFTSNAVRPPHYHFSAYRLSFYEDGTFFASGVIYYVGGVPLLPLPFLYLSPWGTGLITQLGYGNTQGSFIQNTYQFGVPKTKLFSDLLPASYTFFLDYYHFTGGNAGVQLVQETKNLDYIISLAYARFNRYTIENGKITNDVNICEGEAADRNCTKGNESFNWYKTNIFVHSKTNDPKDNHARNIHIRYEYYNHYLYEYEFGQRFQPGSTVSALYRDLRLSDGIQRPKLNSDLVYEEEWDNLYLRIDLNNEKVWRERQNFQDSFYETVETKFPSIELHKRFALGTLPLLETPVYWNHRLHHKSIKNYKEGNVFYTSSKNEYRTDIALALPFLSWLYWDTKAGYGILKTVLDSETQDSTEKISLEHEGERSNYSYWFSKNVLALGEESLLLELTHLYKDSFDADRPDILHIDRSGFANNQEVNELQYDLSWFALPNMSFHTNTAYDFRTFPVDVPVKSRWHYPIFRTDILLDWLNLFQEGRENLLSRNKVYFLNTHITNDYIYDPIHEVSHSNAFGITFEMGGFDTWLFRRLRYLETGFQWHHFYADPFLDHIRYVLKLDIQLTNWVYLEIVSESRASDPGRYSRSSLDQDGNSDYVNFGDDLINSLGLRGGEKQNDSIFNTVYFHTAVILDLGDWEFRLGFEQEQRYIPQTSGNTESLVYYDQKFFFGLNLIHFDIGGYGKRPSRFLFRRPEPVPN